MNLPRKVMTPEKVVFPVGLILILVAALCFITTWRVFAAYKDNVRREYLESSQQEVVQVLALGTQGLVLALERLGYRWLSARGADQAQWLAGTGRYRQEKAYLSGIAWLEEGSGVRWMDPPLPSLDAPNWADPSASAELRALLSASRLAQATRFSPVRAARSGAAGAAAGNLVVVTPLIEGDRFAGWLLARVDVGAYLQLVQPPSAFRDLRMQLLQADGLSLYGPELESDHLTVQTTLEIYGQSWEVRLAAGPDLDRRLNLWQIDVAHGFLLLLFLALALLLRFAIIRSIDARTLRSTLAIHETVMNTLTDGLILIDQDGFMRKVNQATLSMFGYREDELLGSNVKMLMPAPYQARHDGYLRRFLATGRKHILDISRKVEGLKKNRSVFPIELFVRQMFIDDRPFFMGVVRDISEQTRASKALESERSRLFQTESLLDSAIRSSGVGFALLTLDGHLIEVNGAFASLVERSPSAMSGLTLEETLPIEEWRGIEGEFRSLAAGEIVSLTREVRLLRGSGAVFWGLLSISRVLNEHQKAVSLAAQVIDIDKEKRLALQVELRALELERSNQDLDRFAYVASHDLKSPLRGIAQLASWIEEDADPGLGEETRAHLVAMRRRVSRMEKLLDDLLTYSRAGRRDESVGPVNVEEMVQALFELLAPPPHFSLHIASVLPVFETCSTPLQLVLRNLLSNCIKHFSGDLGVIRVSCQVKRGYYEFCVEDNGPGIPPQFQEKVFEMFQTLRPRDEVEGSGMGLALVRKVVQQQGGTVHIESDGHQGTKVYFTWPR